MAVEEDIFSGLTGNAGLSALIQRRVFPHIPRGLPQRAELPAITYQQISGNHTITHAGRARTMQGRFQLMAFGKTAIEANEVMARLIPALASIPRVKITAIEGPRDGSDPTVTTDSENQRMRGLPWKSIDVFMWYRQ